DRVLTLPADLGTVRPSHHLLLHGPAVLAAEALPLQFQRRGLRAARTTPTHDPRPLSAFLGRSSRSAKIVRRLVDYAGPDRLHGTAPTETALRRSAHQQLR